ncbi:MAG: cobalt-zinc-cadmium efflux system membrane fusion protein [Patescibacteria group bacterium]|jgi:cobalt-zinc-cadmium efflux system membrane fusion protein
MKYIYFSAILLAGLLVLMSSCKHEHGEGTHTHGDETHAPHGPELEPFAFTIWTEKSEIFVEFPPLIVGKESRFAAHFSEMVNFKALQAGEVTVRLRKGTQSVKENSVSAPSSPGIFRPAITPDKEGVFDLVFFLKTGSFSDTITISSLTVYPNAAAAMAANPPQPEGDEISFLKEQAWKIDFAIQQVKRQPIREVIHTSGEIQPVKGDEKIIAAKSSGIVFFKSKSLQEGRDVRSGESLFSISSKGLLQSNMEEKYQVAKARVENTKADFERAENLVNEKIIGQKEYERRKMEYTIAQAEFQTLTGSYNKGGQSVTATMTGIVKNVLVSDGQFVEEGTPLIEITSNRRLLLQAEVSQSHLPKLRMVKSANFKTSYQKEVQSIDDYNGKLISYGKVIEQGRHFIPVLFELDNLHELIPGSFVELFLLTNLIEKELVISKSALMQDYSMNYVYVQTGGESFEKREVKLGVDDGVNIQILSGVTEGEWVVTEGAYQIKMASMSSTIPAHGHEH